MMGENAHAMEQVGAVGGTGAMAGGYAALEGRYTFECRGPREGCLDRYLELRTSAECAEAVRDFDLAESLYIEAEALTELKWTDTIDNLVVNVGKNLALDTLLGGSAYTVTGPFMGLVSGTPTPAAGDTMTSHAGWTEVGGANAPAYTAPRKTVSFSAAASGSKASTGTYTYAITSAGTVGGAFIVLGTGAVSTLDSTAGVLYSAGAFTGGNKVVANGDSLTVTYTASM